MSTAISVLGGIGLFLLGMTVMTGGLKALAGSALRTVLNKAAATPLHGSFWGAIVTLLVQSSSATTMTTIGLVSAGLLTFPQGLGLVFGANVGTTGTGWLVALIGVRVSLTAAALPMIFFGALIKLLGRGRVSGAGAALAGFGLVLFGLTTLQQGMGGLAERLHPADLPVVLAGPDAGWWRGMLGVLVLVVVGLVMTALMQSSTAAIAVTLFRPVRGCDWARPSLRVDRRAEHRNGDEFRVGGDRSEHHRQAVSHSVCTIQADPRLDRASVFSPRHPSARPCLERDRRRDPAGRLSHGVQCRRSPRPAADG